MHFLADYVIFHFVFFFILLATENATTPRRVLQVQIVACRKGKRQNSFYFFKYKTALFLSKLKD